MYPYGYLLVDLKPFTPENQRLKCIRKKDQNSESTSHVPIAIKGGHVPVVHHSATGTQTDHIVNNSEQENLQNNSEFISTDIMEKGQACDDCGQLFDTVHDVQRHVKRGWCPENNEPPAKKQKTADDVMETYEDVEDNQGYQHMWHLAQNLGKDKYNKLYDEYIDQGENEDDASELAEERTRPYTEKNFFKRYQSELELYWFPLMRNGTHRSIVDQINNLRQKGVDITTAKRTLKKNRHVFEDLFELDESDEEEESDDDGREDETI